VEGPAIAGPSIVLWSAAVAELDRIGGSGQREQTVDVRRSWKKDEPAAQPSRAGARKDDRPGACRVDEREVAHIEHDQLHLGGGVSKHALKLRRGREVQFARDVHKARLTTIV